MTVETLCQTDVCIPTSLLDDVTLLFPGVPPDIAIRKVAITVARSYCSKINPHGDYPYTNPDQIVFVSDGESVERVESTVVRVGLPVRVVNKLTMMMLQDDPSDAIVFSVIQLLTKLARSEWWR